MFPIAEVLRHQIWPHISGKQNFFIGLDQKKDKRLIYETLRSGPVFVQSMLTWLSTRSLSVLRNTYYSIAAFCTGKPPFMA